MAAASSFAMVVLPPAIVEEVRDETRCHHQERPSGPTTTKNDEVNGHKDDVTTHECNSNGNAFGNHVVS